MKRFAILRNIFPANIDDAAIRHLNTSRTGSFDMAEGDDIGIMYTQKTETAHDFLDVCEGCVEFESLTVAIDTGKSPEGFEIYNVANVKEPGCTIAKDTEHQRALRLGIL